MDVVPYKYQKTKALICKLSYIFLLPPDFAVLFCKYHFSRFALASPQATNPHLGHFPTAQSPPIHAPFHQNMIFSRLGRALSRSSRSRFQIVRTCSIFPIFYDFFFGVFIDLSAFQSGASGRSDGRSACLKDPIRQWQHAREGDGGLGFSRSYLTLIGADKGFAAKKVLLSDLGFVFASSRIRRLYCSEAPKKKSKMGVFLVFLDFVVIMLLDSVSRFCLYG